MSQRWWILGVLFLARLAMAFQFQSTAALSPFLLERYGIGLTDLGILIGLYLAPGVVVAIPGGAIAAWFGDKRVVGVSLGLMLLGGGLMLFGPSWGWAIAGRVLAGIGGVIINIVMTKMLVDWFTGREIATAMAIYINSWPAGIALALMILPGLAEAGGLDLARSAVLTLIAIGWIVFLLGYRTPPGLGTKTDVRFRAGSIPVPALTLAALVWGLYNAALVIAFSFGPTVLTEIGWTVERGSFAFSLFMVLLSVAVPLGGVLADRTGQRNAVIMVSLLGYAPLLGLSTLPDAALLFVAVAGFLFGLAAGPIMTLPSLVLPAETRAFGMGVFFAIYYAAMMTAPALAGALAEASGTAMKVIWFGSALVIASILGLIGFNRLHRAEAVP